MTDDILAAAHVIRGRKENATQSFHFGYSQNDIERALAIINDLADMMGYEFSQMHSDFDWVKWREAVTL